MYLSKKEALELIKLGFIKAYDDYEVLPFDVYSYDDTEWVVGGKIFPNGNLTSPEEVYKKGIWLPTIHNLLSWLEANYCVFTLINNGYGYKIEVKDSNNNFYKDKCGTCEGVLYNVIVKILKKHGGNPQKRKCETYEIINREDL